MGKMVVGDFFRFRFCFFSSFWGELHPGMWQKGGSGIWGGNGAHFSAFLFAHLVVVDEFDLIHRREQVLLIPQTLL